MVNFGGYRVNRGFSTLAGLALAASSFAQLPADQPITIEVGTLSAEDGDGWILSQIRSFEEAHPNIRIRHFAIGTPSRDEVRIEDLSELALNVVGVRSDLGYEISCLVDWDLLVPLETFLPDAEFDFDDFFPNVWDYVTYNGRRWGAPYLCSSVVLIADWEVFQNSGVLAPPTTWEEFLNVLPMLTKDTDGDGVMDQWGFRLGMRGRHDTHMYFLWMTKVLQEGGYVMKEGRFELTHPALRRSYEFFDRVQKSPGAREDNRRFKDSAGDLASRYGMQIAPSYYLNPLMKQLNYRIVPWVTSGEKAILDERRHYLCVCKSAPEKEKASWEFLKWVVRPEAVHPDGAWTFHLSARKDLLDRKDVQHKIASWAKGFDVLHEMKGWNVHHGDQVPGRFEAIEHLEEIVTGLFRGELIFEEAMDKAESECNAMLEATNQSVEFRVLAPDEKESLKAADGFRNRREFIKASLAYLDFWRRYPDAVEAKGLRFRILSCLRNANLHAEAETLATWRRPQIAADLLHGFLETGATFTLAVDRNSSIESSSLVGEESIPHLIHEARLAAASSFEGKPALNQLEEFFDRCGALAKSERGPGNETEVLSVYQQGLLDLVLRLRANGERNRSLIGDYEPNSDKDFAVRIAGDSIEIACIAAQKNPDLIPLVFNSLDSRIDLARKTGAWDGAFSAYRKVADRFPEAEEVSGYSLAMSVLMKEEANNLEAALAVCSQIEERNPGSDVSEEARWNRALWLYEAGRFREAKTVLDTILAEKGKNWERAKLVSALCRFAFGEKVEAEKEVKEFIHLFPDQELVPRAKVWLVSNQIADFQFLEAAESIQSIVQDDSSNSSTTPLDSVYRRLLAAPF